MTAVHQFQWVIWLIGALVFAGVIGLLIRAVWRSGKREPELHSAAEKLLGQTPLPAEVTAQLRELSRKKELGQIGDADYARERERLLQGH
jgi:hypothetical protein